MSVVEIKGIKKVYNYFCPTQCRILACHQFEQFEQLIADIFVENTFEADLQRSKNIIKIEKIKLNKADTWSVRQEILVP